MERTSGLLHWGGGIEAVGVLGYDIHGSRDSLQGLRKEDGKAEGDPKTCRCDIDECKQKAEQSSDKLGRGDAPLYG